MGQGLSYIELTLIDKNKKAPFRGLQNKNKL